MGENHSRQKVEKFTGLAEGLFWVVSTLQLLKAISMVGTLSLFSIASILVDSPHHDAL